MAEMCHCPPEAGNIACELRVQANLPPLVACPECCQAGKKVQGQTVKALLSISLRTVRDTDYLFCLAQACPVVFFSADGAQAYSVEEVRERVYQKEPDADGVFVCYCFRYTVGEVWAASTEERAQIVADINGGIQAGQCACDLRNPQGSCCLGNVRGLIKQFGQGEAANVV